MVLIWLTNKKKASISRTYIEETLKNLVFLMSRFHPKKSNSTFYSFNSQEINRTSIVQNLPSCNCDNKKEKIFIVPDGEDLIESSSESIQSSTNLKSSVSQEDKLYVEESNDPSPTEVVVSSPAPTATTLAEEETLDSVRLLNPAAPSGPFLELSVNRFDRNQPSQDVFEVIPAYAESLNVDQNCVSLTAAADPKADINLDLLLLPLSIVEVPQSEEEKLDFLLGREYMGHGLLRYFIGEDHKALTEAIQPDLFTQEDLQKTMLSDVLARLEEANIKLIDMAELCTDRAAIIAGLLVEVGLSSKTWQYHAVNPEAIFDYVFNILSSHW